MAKTKKEQPTAEQLLSGNLSANSNQFDIEWTSVSDLPDGTHEFILLFGDPATNAERDPNHSDYQENEKLWSKVFDGKNAVYNARCSLFTTERPKGQFVAEWFYTHSDEDPGHVLGLDNRANDYGGVWPYPQEIWTIPVLSGFSTKDDEWNGDSGKFTYLKMNAAQWRAILRETGKVAVKFANLKNKGLRLTKDTSKGTKGSDMYQWSMPDPVTVYDVNEYLGEEFDALQMLDTERQNLHDKNVYDFFDDGVANVWAMLEETTGLTKEQIIANPLYNTTTDNVGKEVNSVDLTLDT